MAGIRYKTYNITVKTQQKHINTYGDNNNIVIILLYYNVKQHNTTVKHKMFTPTSPIVYK